MADEDITVRARLLDELSQPASKAEHAIDDLKDAAKQASPSVERMGKSLDRAGKAAKDSAVKSEGAAKATKHLGKSAFDTARAMEIAAMSTEDYADALKKMTAYERRAASAVRAQARAAKSAAADQALLADSTEEAADAAAEQAAKLAADNRELKKNKKAALEAALAQKVLGLATRQAMFYPNDGKGGKKGGIFGGLAVGLNPMRFIKLALIPTILDAVGALATLGSAAGAAGMAAVGGLAPLTGVLVAYPGYLAAIGQGFGVFKMALSGTSDLIAAAWSGDAKKLEEALKTATPAAKQFAKTVMTLKNPFEDMRKSVQAELLPALGQTVGVIRGMMPMLKTIAVSTAQSMSGVVQQFNSFLKSSQGRIGQLGRGNIPIINNLGRAGISGIDILLKTLTAAQPMLQRMSIDVAMFMSRMSALAGARQNGLARFFDTAYRVMQKVLKFAGDIGKALYNIAKIGVPLGSEMGDVFLRLAEKFRDFTESESGVGKIKNWFDQMKPVIWEVGYLVRDIAKGFASISMDKSLVGTLQTIRTSLLPAIFSLTKDASGKFISTFAEILGTLAKIMVDLQVFPSLLKTIADILDTVASIIKSMPQWLQTALGYLVTMMSLLKFTGGVAVFTNLKAAVLGLAGTFALMPARIGLMVTAWRVAAIDGVSTFGKIKMAAMQSGASMGKVATAIRLAYVAAFAAIIYGAVQANSRMNEMIEDSKAKAAELNKQVTDDSVNAVKAAAEAARKAREEYTSHNWFTSLFQGETWSDAATAVGNFLTGSDNPYINDKINEAERAAQDALAKYNKIINLSTRETGAARNEVEKYAKEMGLDMTQGVGQAYNALSEWIKINKLAPPAAAALYNSINTVRDAAATAAQKTDAFKSSLEALFEVMHPDAKNQDAAVAAAESYDQYVAALTGNGDPTQGAKYGFSKKKKPRVSFDATVAANRPVHYALRSANEAAMAASVENFRVTQSVETATRAYKEQRVAIDNATAANIRAQAKQQGVTISQQEALAAATKLNDQYFLTPDQITTAFNTPGLREVLMNGGDLKDVQQWLMQNPNVTTTYSAPGLSGILASAKELVSTYQQAGKLSLLQSQMGAAYRPTVYGAAATPTAPQSPKVDTSSLDTAQDKANTFKKTLMESVGPWIPQTPTSGPGSIDLASTAATGLFDLGGKIATTPRTMPMNSIQITAAKAEANRLQTITNDLTSRDHIITYRIVTEGTTPQPAAANGGPISPFIDYLVGERGPEVFVPQSGKPQVIGRNGQQHMTFDQAGFVIPNHMLPTMSGSGSSGGAPAPRGRTAVKEVRPEINVGAIYATKDVDVENALARAYRRLQKDYAERGRG